MAHNVPSGINLGGSISAAATSQSITPRNFYRRGIRFQNTSDTDMWVNQHGSPAAVGVGFKIAPGVMIDLITQEGITVFCTGLGKTFAATDI